MDVFHQWYVDSFYAGLILIILNKYISFEKKKSNFKVNMNKKLN